MKIPLGFTVFGKEKTSRKKKVVHHNVFDTFAVKTSVANRKMVGRFHRVIFRMTKVLMDKVAK